jgi:hypothetical protein
VKWLALVAALFSAPAGAAYDANGVALGASEALVTKTFPGVACQPLQWSSSAADRRCDDRVTVGGVQGRITFYLKEDRVQAFDLRFDPKDAERLAGYLKKRYGAPAREAREKVESRSGGGGERYRLQWQSGSERAVLTSQSDKRRAFFTVSRGDFEEEIYGVR